MGAGSIPQRGARIIHHGADELHIKKHSVFVLEGTQNANPLSSFHSNLVDLRRPDEFIYDYFQITSSFDTLDWFPEECYWSGLNEAPSDTREYYRAALGNVYGDSPFAEPPLKDVEVVLQVANEQRGLEGRAL